jgi:hypothetical protein
MLSENTLKAMRGALFMRAQSLGGIESQHTQDAILMYEGTHNALAFVDAMLRGDTIASLWSIEDVQGLATDDDGEPDGSISVDEARKVLKLADSEHDASIGINWEVLEYHLDYIRRK